MFQASYTYSSHSIDNISDPMLSDVFNLAATNADTIGAAHSFGMFTRQFDSRADRGNSDFDIRQNLTLYSVWDLPAPGRSKWMGKGVGSWTAAGMAAIRSGLPYTSLSPQVSLPINQAVLVGARRCEDLRAPELLSSRNRRQDSGERGEWAGTTAGGRNRDAGTERARGTGILGCKFFR